MRLEVKDINLYDTFFSGQCFRMIIEEDGSITNVIKDRVINIREENGYLVINSNNEVNLEEVIKDYLDLYRNYDEINDIISNKNDILKSNIELVKGYKILKQDRFEMFITYIISQNNRVSKISKSVEKLSQKFGEKVTFNDKDYYLFPKFEEIKDITLEELREAGVGFRDKYIKEALEFLENNPKFLEEIDNMDTERAIEELTKIKGIGLKVASCILMFGYSRFDSFPIDTWVKKFVSENFNIKDNMKDISSFMKNTFGEYSGLAIQYFYHIERNKR